MNARLVWQTLVDEVLVSENQSCHDRYPVASFETKKYGLDCQPRRIQFPPQGTSAEALFSRPQHVQQ